MVIKGVKKKLFKRIEYKGKIYKRTDTPTIGGIAESIVDDEWSTKGRFYLINDFISGDGNDTSIIGDDGEPCGVHKDFSNRYFIYYKKR